MGEVPLAPRRVSLAGEICSRHKCRYLCVSYTSTAWLVGRLCTRVLFGRETGVLAD
jgi:hypothetical protein